jgi:hypothetical protein
MTDQKPTLEYGRPDRRWRRVVALQAIMAERSAVWWIELLLVAGAIIVTTAIAMGLLAWQQSRRYF